MIEKPKLHFEIATQSCWSHLLFKPKANFAQNSTAPHNGQRFLNSASKLEAGVDDDSKMSPNHSDCQHIDAQNRNAQHSAHQPKSKGRKVWPLLKWIATRESDSWHVNRVQTAQQHTARQRDIPINRPHAALDDWRVYFVSHATVLLQIGPYNFLTDPVWCDYVSHQAGLGPRSVCPAGLALEELPTIHAVLLSHNHYDHMDLATLTWLHARFAMPIYTGLGNAAYLPKTWHVLEMDWWQRLTFAELEVIYVPAQHGSGRGVRDQNTALWGGFSVLSTAGHAYFAGDTGYGAHFSQIRTRLGAPRVALLPIGAYEPRALMRFVHMNPSDAVQAHLDLQSQCSLGIHFNRYQLTDEARDTPVQDLQRALHECGIEDGFVAVAEGVAVDVSL